MNRANAHDALKGQTASLMSPGTRGLIVHADDLGLCRSTTEAIVQAMEIGVVTSASVMVPCLGFRHAAKWLHARSDLDLGLHVTLTSEWRGMRWGPVADRKDVSSLLAADGGFWPDVKTLTARAKPAHVAIEIKAQIESALGCGLSLSHIDCHMGAVFQDQRLYEIYVRLAREYHLGFLAAANRGPKLRRNDGDNYLWRHGVLEISNATSTADWLIRYQNILETAVDPVMQLLVHPAFDTPELKAITLDTLPWGASWRRADFEVVTNPLFRDFLERRQFSLLSWRDLSRRHVVEALIVQNG